MDQQVLDETQRQLKSGQASLEASRAAVKTRDAQRLAAEATTEKTKTDISAAEARVQGGGSPTSAGWRPWSTTSRSPRPTTASSSPAT